MKQNKIRFVQKLKTLLLSKPKHYLPIQTLAKCRSYLCLPKPRSVLTMIYRYPTIFELFTISCPPTPMNATKLYPQLCVRLTPSAEALAAEEAKHKNRASVALADKLQKLLMLSPHRRLLLNKLVHIGPDLGLPPNFRSRLCNEHPDRFVVVDTSFGRALELVSWDPELGSVFPEVEGNGRDQDLIVDRPMKFKHLKLRKGLNLKRYHHDFLIKFSELPDICPYKTSVGEFPKESMEEEKRACNVVREILGMMVEKRTLVDHLTHFRKDFGLPNKLRGMLVRHPELFYVSLKGQRDSVFLVEAYNDNGVLVLKDEAMVIKDMLLGLVREGKRIRREKRKVDEFATGGNYVKGTTRDEIGDVSNDIDEDDGFGNLFEWDDAEFGTYDEDGGYGEVTTSSCKGNFWIAESFSKADQKGGESLEPW